MKLGEEISDMPRQYARDFRKKLGLPASKDVGTISNMIRALRDKASEFVGQPVTAAAISILHLAALYGEDLFDAFEHLSLVYLEFGSFRSLRPIPATISAYVGNGHGLCEDYREVAACKEEEAHIPSRFALSVSYTDTSLITSQARLSNANSLDEGPTRENLRLGYNARHQEGYLEAVRDMVRSPIVDIGARNNLSIVLLLGDATEELSFRQLLEEG